MITKREAEGNIRVAMKHLGIAEGKDTYTTKEINEIVRWSAGVDHFYVMQYLRYGRIKFMF